MTEQPNALKGIPLTIHPVKKTEQVPNKPLEQPKCKTCNDTRLKWIGHGHRRHRESCPDCEPEQPNTELLIVKTIQGLTTCISNELEKLVVLRGCMPINNMMVVIDQAIEDINSFEKTTLELQKAFE